MPINKKHWYDGWFYDKIIAPSQDKLFEQLAKLIDNESSVIDVGCGTGRLAFALANKCKSVLGIDLSKRNIDQANLTLLQNPDTKISFKHSSVTELGDGKQTHFDYAVLTYVIHEVNEEERVNLLKDISLVANKIIIGDFIVPMSRGFDGRLNKFIEFIAGKEHYRNYKSYMANGGIYYLAKKAGLKIIDEKREHSSTNHIVVLTKYTN